MKEGDDSDENEQENEFSKKGEDNIQNQEISKKMPIDISEIKDEGRNSFYSDVSLDEKKEIQELNKQNKNNLKNVYNTNAYNIKNDFQKKDSKSNENNKNKIENIDTKEIEDCYNDIKDSIFEKKENNITNNDKQNIESNIKILTYIWKRNMLLSGYYEFGILFTKKDVDKDKILTQRTIYRSYQDIKLLYEGLILYNPGCLIPKIPEKTFWENFKENAEEKKTQLENYLGYICKHIYLSKNPIFLIFISDEFERYREKIKENNESISIYSLIKLGINQSYKFSKDFIFKKLISSSSANIENDNVDPNSNIEISDKKLRSEKLRLEKIANGTEKFITSLNEEIISVSNKIESLKNLHKISEILKDSNFRVELNQNNIDDKFLEQKNFFSLESIVYLKMSESYEIYIKEVKEIYRSLIKYKEVTEALIEAFIRKEKVELELKKEKNADFLLGENKNEKMREMTEQVRQIGIQFYEDLSNYHKNIENMFSTYANNYIDIKNETDKQNQIILMNKSFPTSSGINTTEK